MAVQTFRDFKAGINFSVNDEKFVFPAEEVKVVPEVVSYIQLYFLLQNILR